MASNLAQASPPLGGRAMMGWGRPGGGGPAPWVPCPLFALLDLGVPRVGRWSCLTQRACVHVCACVSVYLSLPGPGAAEGRDKSSAHGGRGELPALVCTLPTSPTLVPFWGMNG